MKGKQEGYGVYIWVDNRKYEGNFFDGKQHGIGYFTSKKGEKKKGQWINGKRTVWFDEE